MIRHNRAVRVLLAAFAALAVILLAACSGSDNSGDTSGGSATGSITVAEPSDNPGDIQARKKLADQFMKLHPDIPVKILVIPAQNYDEKVLTLIAGGKPPDLFVSGDVQIANMVSKNYAVNLDDFAKKDNYDLSQFYPQIVDGLTFNGSLAGLTDNWDTQVMYYNKTMFDDAKVPTPTADWTWDDFQSAAQKLTSGSGSHKQYGAVFDPWFAPLYSTIWSFGGDVTSADGKTCELNQPPAVEAINFILNLYKQGISPSPQAMSQQGQGAEQIFLSGRAAMMIGSGRWAAYDLQTVKRFQWEMAPLPQGPSGRANFFHLSMFGIARTSTKGQAAWEFLKYMLSKKGIETTIGNAQGLPSVPSLVKDPAFANSPVVKQHDTVDPMLTSLPTAHRAPNIVAFNEFGDKQDAAFDPVWSGKQDPQAAMDAFCKSIDPLLQEGSAAGG
jgi:multiple sugar transport system substrate-binding protein